jgi:hypothetical protein
MSRSKSLAESCGNVIPHHPHANHHLFSDHYLGTRLPLRPEWRALAAEAEAVRGSIRELLAAYTPSANEAQTEDGLIKPVLRLLGHTFEIQAPLATPDGVKKPDYVLYRDEAAQVANRGQKLTDTLLAGRAIAVADAKYWDRPLDVALRGRGAGGTSGPGGTSGIGGGGAGAAEGSGAGGSSGGDPFTNRNPSYQIAFYMQHSGVDWGILTNGRLWRLYHRDSAHKLDRFYEVDLPALVADEDGEAFLYFYAFFRRAAFEAGPLALAAILAASADYARGVSDTLKRQVFDALRHVAQGFLDHPPNGLAVEGRAPDAVALRVIYESSLRVLYRLLFLLYAEAGGLLPLRENAMYRDFYSLAAIKEAVRGDLDAGRRLLPATATLWQRLRALFEIIDAGSVELGVPPYNGGLFAAKAQPFLELNAVGDAHLQRAIDKLARVDGQFVDYRDLAVRHLGTIYEGLLEFHLALLDAPEFVDGLRWSVALVDDKGERKATGSYYTPDYIVKFMVDQTVGPALAAAVAEADRRSGASAGTAVGAGAGADGLPAPSVTPAMERARIDAVLNLNLLDPAMGSGHFPSLHAFTLACRSLAVQDEGSVGEKSPHPRRPHPHPRRHRRPRDRHHRRGAGAVCPARAGAAADRGGPGRAGAAVEPEADGVVGARLPGLPRGGAACAQARDPAARAGCVGCVAGRAGRGARGAHARDRAAGDRAEPARVRALRPDGGGSADRGGEHEVSVWGGLRGELVGKRSPGVAAERLFIKIAHDCRAALDRPGAKALGYIYKAP